MYQRKLDLGPLTAHKSLILLGPRQTGKSTLLKTLFPRALTFNLLDDIYFREFSAHPELLRQRIPSLDQGPPLVIIDEIQRIPSLLNEVQLILDSHPGTKFILTGSSARKLKRGEANLLGGRARFAQLFPLVYPEIGSLRLNDRLVRGSMPSIIDSPEFIEDLRAYVGGYLKEEIQAESLVRNIGNFSRFLEVAALVNGEQTNFAAISSDTGIPARTIRDFFTLLEDTLVGELLAPFTATKQRKAVTTPKFFFFDVGVANALIGRFNLTPGTPEFGRAFEHLIYQELKAWISYARLDLKLGFWRSQAKHEVDFTVGDHLAVEVKAKNLVAEKDLKGIRALQEEKIFKHLVVVSQERVPRRVDGIDILPVEEFFLRLWSGEWNK